MLRQLDDLIESLEALEADERLLPALARVLKKFHAALIQAGFTENDATHIITGGLSGRFISRDNTPGSA